MPKSEIQLEFDYSAKIVKDDRGNDCLELTLQPTGQTLSDVFNEDFNFQIQTNPNIDEGVLLAAVARKLVDDAQDNLGQHANISQSVKFRHSETKLTKIVKQKARKLNYGTSDSTLTYLMPILKRDKKAPEKL